MRGRRMGVQTEWSPLITLFFMRKFWINCAKAGSAVCLLLLTTCGRADPLDTWTWRNPLPTANTLLRIAYAEDQFVAVGEAGTILISHDGSNWASRRSGTEVPLFGVAYGDGRFVVVGGNYQHLGGLSTDSIIVTSTNAADWEMIELPGLGQLRDVAYGNGQFV